MQSSDQKGRPSTPDQVVVDLNASSPNNCKPPSPSSARSTAAAPKPRPALTRLPVSKPKSRFLELNYPQSIDGNPKSQPPHPVISDSDSDDDNDFDDEEQLISDKLLPETRRRFGWRALAEWVFFVTFTACLVSSLIVPSLKRRELWGLRLWKWCLMVLVVLCGRLVSGWLVWVVVFGVERHFLLREKVLYFVYGLRRSVRSCFWLGLVLLSWTLVIDPHVENPVLLHFSRFLVAVLVAAIIWLIKILLVKVLASSFHVATFFDRMKESVFHHYILEALSGFPKDESSSDGSISEEEAAMAARRKGGAKMRAWKTMPARLDSNPRRIDMERLRRLSQVGASACSVRRLAGHVMKTGLSTLAMTVDRTVERFGKAESDMTSEWEARVSAERIFRNVAKPCHKYIEEEDLMRFLSTEEVQTIFPLFEGALESGKIKKSAFRNWVVRAYRERKSLAHSLNDTKTAVQQLHKIASVVVSIIIVVVSLLVTGVTSMKVFVVIASQMLVASFLFQNTGKTIFESIIFVFVVHPFDVGDRCVIDGVQMIVEEMNILTTVFLRYDNEKIYYPNSVLLMKPISNFYRSPDMGESIEFSIDVSTPVETVAALRKSIQAYLESKPKYWHPKHSVLVKEIENVNRMKMALNVLHTMNHQNFPEKNYRRSELVFEMKKIFENLEIKYHLLPQEVHLSQVVMADARIPAPVVPKQG